MTSIINAFQIAMAPSEAKALFKPDMGNNEKLKICSAIKAIDSSRRKRISELTQKVGTHCTIDTDRIITLISRIGFSEIACDPFLTASKGLRTGDDLAKLLVAINQILLTKYGLCNQISSLFRDEMPAEDRVSILSELDLLDPVVRGLKEGEDLTEILYSFIALPAEKRLYCRSSYVQFTKEMSVKDRALILGALNLINDSNALYSLDSTGLTRGLKTGKEFVRILSAVSKIPKDQVDFVLFSLPADVREMSVEKKIELLEEAAIKRWYSPLNLKELSVRERLQLKTVVEAFSIKSEDVAFFVSNLLGETIVNLESIMQMLNTFAALKPEEFEGTYDSSIRLVNNSMGIEDRIKILNAVAALPSAERKSINDNARRLIKDTMNAEDRIKILNAVAAIPSTERASISSFNSSARHLIIRQINAEDRIKVLNAAAALPSLERESISRSATLLTPNTMNAEDHVNILNAIAALPQEERESICNHALTLIPANTDAEGIIEILNTVAAIPPEGQGFILGSTTSKAELIVDRDKLDKNPVAILENLINIFDDKKWFPDIRFQTSAGVDEIGVDAGGMTRGVVTDLMKALHHQNPTNQRKLPMMTTEKGIVPKIENDSDVKPYRSIGMIFSKALTRYCSILTGNHFNPTLFQMIHALTQEELSQIPQNLSNLATVPQPIQNKLLKLYLRSELRTSFGEPNISEEDLQLAINTFIDNGTINTWMSNTCSINSKEEFLTDYGLKEILLASLVIAQSMQQCMDRPNTWNAIKGTTSEELRKKVEGALTKEQVTAALNLSDTTRKGFLTRWIEEASLKELEELVFCISGGTTLQQGQLLRFNLQPDSPNLPVFHTCSFQMDLPRYETYEKFKEKLGLSIKLITDGNIGGGLA